MQENASKYSWPQSYGTLKNKEIVLYVLVAFFFLCHVKDLKDIEGDRAGGVFNIFDHVFFPRVFGLLFFGAFLVQVCFIAALLGIARAPMWAGVILCAGSAVFYAARVRELAKLDKLLVLSFLFLLYVSGAWLAHLGT